MCVRPWDQTTLAANEQDTIESYIELLSGDVYRSRSRQCQDTAAYQDQLFPQRVNYRMYSCVAPVLCYRTL